MTASRRWFFAGVIVVALVAGAVFTDRDPETVSVAEVGPRLPSSGDGMAAWYCAEGTSLPDGRADEEIQLGNVDTRGARATITVFGGSDVAPVRRRYRISPGRVVRVRVADIAAVPEPGVLVEVQGGRTVVEHRVVRGDDQAFGPCAREPHAITRFAAGTTAAGAELWLALFNPFPDDAIVDVRANTGSGIRAPGSLQAMVVPRYSRVSVAIHDRLPRVDLVAIEVETRRGRVVAEQSLSLDGTDGRRGIAVTLGAESARQWRFPIGLTGSGHTERLVVSNPSSNAARITVRYALDAAAAIEPESVMVSGTSVIAIDLARVPPDIGFSVVLDASVPVVAELVGASAAPQPAAARGIAADIGLTTGAREWAVLSRPRVAGSSDMISVVAVDRRPHRIAIMRADASGRTVISRMQVPARGRVTTDLVRLVRDVDAALLIRSDGLIVVERESVRPGITRSHAVPASAARR